MDLPLQRFGYCVKMLTSSTASFIADFLFTSHEFRDKTCFETFLDKVASFPQFTLYLNCWNLLACSNLFKCRHVSALFCSALYQNDCKDIQFSEQCLISDYRVGIIRKKIWLFSHAAHSLSVVHRSGYVIPIALLLQLSE